jgi:hypothetical protein
MDTISCKIQGYHACFPGTKTGRDISSLLSSTRLQQSNDAWRNTCKTVATCSTETFKPSNDDRTPMMFFLDLSQHFLPVRGHVYLSIYVYMTGNVEYKGE